MEHRIATLRNPDASSPPAREVPASCDRQVRFSYETTTRPKRERRGDSVHARGLFDDHFNTDVHHLSALFRRHEQAVSHESGAANRGSEAANRGSEAAGRESEAATREQNRVRAMRGIVSRRGTGSAMLSSRRASAPFIGAAAALAGRLAFTPGPPRTVSMSSRAQADGSTDAGEGPDRDVEAQGDADHVPVPRRHRSSCAGSRRAPTRSRCARSTPGSPTLPDYRTGLLGRGGVECWIRTTPAPGDPLRVADSTCITCVTCVPTRAGFLGPTVVVDALGRRVAGGSTAVRPRTEPRLEALHMAQRRRCSDSVVHHSNQDRRQASYELEIRCSETGIVASTGSAGECCGNAMAESFFATLECDLIDHRRFPVRTEVRMASPEYIEGWHSPHHRHPGLGYRSPASFEKSRRQSARAPS